MKKKYFIVPAFAFMALFGASATMAHGGNDSQLWRTDVAKAMSNWTERMTKDASILGISVGEMKSYWANGKNMADIAKEKGISDTDLQAKLKTERLANVKAELQAMVTSGAITQAQADTRLKFMQDNIDKKLDRMGGKHGRGMGKGMGMGIGMGLKNSNK